MSAAKGIANSRKTEPATEEEVEALVPAIKKWCENPRGQAALAWAKKMKSAGMQVPTAKAAVRNAGSKAELDSL